jgi:hypothetical protein
LGRVSACPGLQVQRAVQTKRSGTPTARDPRPRGQQPREGGGGHLRALWVRPGAPGPPLLAVREPAARCPGKGTGTPSSGHLARAPWRGRLSRAGTPRIPVGTGISVKRRCYDLGATGDPPPWRPFEPGGISSIASPPTGARQDQETAPHLPSRPFNCRRSGESTSRSAPRERRRSLSSSSSGGVECPKLPVPGRARSVPAQAPCSGSPPGMILGMKKPEKPPKCEKPVEGPCHGEDEGNGRAHSHGPAAC